VEQISTRSPGRTPHRSRWMCPKNAVTLWRDCAGAGSWQDLWNRGKRSPRQSMFAGRACDPVGDPRWSSLFLKSCSLWEGLMVEPGKWKRSPPLWRKEWRRQCVMNSPQPPFPVPLRSGGAGREFGSKVKPGKKGGVEGECF